MLEALKNKVYNANQDLLEQSGCEFPWVSVSAIDRETGLVILMPDGGALEPEDMAALLWRFLRSWCPARVPIPSAATPAAL